MDSVGVSAVLTAAGSPLAGKSIQFRLGTSIVNATTGLDGVATASLPILAEAGDQKIDATFADDATHQGSGDSAPFTVLKQGTQLTLTAPDSLPGAANSGVTATLTAMVWHG